LKKFLSLILTLMLILTPISSFANISFTDEDGNDSFDLKVDPPIDKIFYFNEDGTKSTTETAIFVSFTILDGKYLSFESENLLITKVSVKGGDGHRIYVFEPPQSRYENMVSPINDGNNIPDISHYSFEFELDVIEPRPPSPPPPSSSSSSTR